MEVKRSEDIHEDPWAFLEKELETFQQVLRELESGRGIFFNQAKMSCNIVINSLNILRNHNF